MNKKKVVIYFLLILATCAGISKIVDVSIQRLDSGIEDANPVQIEARARTRCGRGGRCKAGMTQDDPSTLAA